MRNGFLLAVAACLVVGGSATAQHCPPGLYFNADYLLWWVKDGPTPGTLVTTGPPGSFGILGNPGAGALFGGNSFDYGTFSGVRATVGGWIDEDATIGFEASGFLLEQKGTGINARSDAAGNPVLGLAIFDVGTNPAGPNTLLAANPGLIAGGVAVSSESRLWGAEANGMVNILRDQSLSIDGMLGFRYLHLEENLATALDSSFLVGPLLTYTVSDRFSTRNQFYGGQVAARLRWRADQFGLGLLGKVGLGSMHQMVSATGSTIINGSAVGAGGVYTQSSNLGTNSTNVFAVVPEVQGELAWYPTDWLRLAVGYNFLYISSVVRPGNQLDYTVNSTRSAISSITGTPVTGPIAPLPQFNRDDFWAHGVSFSVGLSY